MIAKKKLFLKVFERINIFSVSSVLNSFNMMRISLQEISTLNILINVESISVN